MFSAVRELTLDSEQGHDDALAHVLLYVAENTAKVVFNASGSPAPFDKDCGAWLVRCAREFSTEMNDEAFADQLWTVLTQHTMLGT